MYAYSSADRARTLVLLHSLRDRSYQHKKQVESRREWFPSVMAPATLMLTALLAASSLVCMAQLVYPGACLPITPVQNFDLKKYAGLWYENRKYFAFFQLAGTCVTATYVGIPGNDSAVEVLNDGYFFGSPKTVIGVAEKVDPSSTEAKLRVSFTSTPFAAAPSERGNYWVLETDYTSYAVVWSCRQDNDDSNRQNLWILTRDRVPTVRTLAKARKAIETRGLDYNSLTVTDQYNCS
ncbi:Lipocalin/cytosolic fatty-acid binding domain [Trinorchestia longiramus]|nr:Lipocalin/cytosolic fatty-acid binding domain [Trinorchestia longiramus]